MSEWISELAQRLVVSRKRDGRCVYDEQAKRELILACQQPGISVSKVARQCGINSNQLSGWIRRHEREANDCARPLPVIEPYHYLVALFKRLPLAQTVDDYEALLPWNIGLASATASP